MFCDGVLRSEFGRKPSRAVERAMQQLMVEEAVSARLKESGGWKMRLREWFQVIHLRPAYAIALVLVMLGGIYVLIDTLGSRRTYQIGPIPVAVLTDAQNAYWASNATPKVGDTLKTGRMILRSGLVELTFNTRAKVAIEGPADFELIGGNGMRLNAGKLATDVPRRAAGFVVETPTAKIVDLGTRFGAIVADQSSEVDVFQGKVRLNPVSAPDTPAGGYQLTPGMAMVVDDHSAVAAKALSETAFPQPNIQTLTRPQNCGFDVTARAALGQIPLDFGFWSGPAYQITGPTDEVHPAEGPGMLQFLNVPNDPTANSEVWQLVDMRPYKRYFASGNAEVDYSVMFNRVAGGAHTANKFGITLAAFRGSPTDAKSLWENRSEQALLVVDKETAANDKPDTWQKLATKAKMPVDTDFLIVELRAIAPPDAVAGTPCFGGNFADLVDLKITTPMRASSLTINR